MKKYIAYLAAFTALSVTGCRKIESDGQIQVVVVNGGGTSTGKTVTLSGRLTKDTTLLAADDNNIKGLVYVTKGVTLTIQKGAKVKGAFSGIDVAALIVSRGGKIIAQGTATEPIVFTSSSANPASGDWGGIVLCGTAPINTSYLGTNGVYEVEGGINNANNDALAGAGDAAFPVVNANDNSGVLSYVRIEYAGYAFQPDKEINSLTMAAVGKGTTIDHVQVTYAKDDAYEWFGGTVDCKYLIAWKTQDDDFDTDNGYSGNVQFGLIIRDSLIADISTSEAFESDNNATGTTVTPKTSAVFSNVTAIGPRATLSNIGNSLYRAGVQIRRNSAISIYNSIFLGWNQAILIDAGLGTPTDLNINDSTLRIRNTTLAGNTVNVNYTVSASAPTGASASSITSWFTTPFFNNDILTNVSDAKMVQPFNYAAPDPTPFGGSNGNQKILTGASFTDAKVSGAFFKPVTFRGAIAPAGDDQTWWKGWTAFK
jgi:hypothetical protein